MDLAVDVEDLVAEREDVVDARYVALDGQDVAGALDALYGCHGFVEAGHVD